MKKQYLIYGALFLIVVSLVTGQPRLQSDRIAGGGLSFEFWKVKDDQITQFALPITYILPYSPQLKLYAMTSPAFTTWEDSYGGFSDIKLGGHFLTNDNQFLITFGLNLPAGKNALNNKEYRVANVLALPAFNFRVPSLGQGMDFQIGISTARQIGDYIMGGGITYMLKGSYEPYSGLDAGYDPGDELSFTLGAERNVSFLNKDMKLTGDFMYSLYMKDEYDNVDWFKAGNRLLFQVMSQFQIDQIDMVVFIRDRIRGKNERRSGTSIEPEKENSNANQFEIQAIGYYRYTDKLQIKGLVDIRLYSENDYGYGGATLFGLGGGGDYRIAPNLTASGECRFYLGSIKTASKGAAAFGFKLFGGIQYTL